jgi:hypothetical protein
MLQLGEIVSGRGREHLALDDPEVSGLVMKPGGVDWRGHQDEVGVLLLEPVGGLLSTMGGAVVDDSEYAAE